MTTEKSAPVRPEAFGVELKRLRESSGLSLENISDETKISTRILEALESGRFQHLPERVFCRSFVRQFAATVGCDETEIVKLFDQAWELFLESSGSHPSVVQVAPVPGSPIRWRFWLPMALGIAIPIVAGVVILRSPRGQPDIAFVPGDGAAARPSPVMATHAVASPVPSLSTPEAADSSDEEEGTVALAVSVAEGKECWIHYRDRDGHTGQHLLLDGDWHSFELAGPVLLTLGNAGAVTLRIGNKEYREMGLPGQVLHAEVSGAGVVVLGGGGSDE
jgi:cytoskeletal protein RodZ